MISAELVGKLRHKTGSGLMECKRALEEAGGDFENAEQILRKRGLVSAEKKTSRITAEGVVSFAEEGNLVVAIEVNSETDFVARNEKFQELVRSISKAALKCKNIDELKASKISSKTMEEHVSESIAIIGENITFTRMDTISVEEGLVGTYLHNQIGENMGKIVAMVAIESKANKESLRAFGKQLAMHIAASKPVSLDVEALDPNLVARAKEVAIERVKSSNALSVESQMQKFYEENVLLEQTFIMDNKTKISDLVTSKAKEVGEDIKITKFIRFELGETLRKDF